MSWKQQVRETNHAGIIRDDDSKTQTTLNQAGDPKELKKPV
jgi:hypothetical protein